MEYFSVSRMITWISINMDHTGFNMASMLTIDIWVYQHGGINKSHVFSDRIALDLDCRNITIFVAMLAQAFECEPSDLRSSLDIL